MIYINNNNYYAYRLKMLNLYKNNNFITEKFYDGTTDIPKQTYNNIIKIQKISLSRNNNNYYYYNTLATFSGNINITKEGQVYKGLFKSNNVNADITQIRVSIIMNYKSKNISSPTLMKSELVNWDQIKYPLTAYVD